MDRGHAAIVLERLFYIMIGVECLWEDGKGKVSYRVGYLCAIKLLPDEVMLYFAVDGCFISRGYMLSCFLNADAML